MTTTFNNFSAPAFKHKVQRNLRQAVKVICRISAAHGTVQSNSPGCTNVQPIWHTPAGICTIPMLPPLSRFEYIDCWPGPSQQNLSGWLGLIRSKTAKIWQKQNYEINKCISCIPRNYNSLKINNNNNNNSCFIRPFVWDYPDKLVPEETLIHPPSWSSSNIYQLLPSTTFKNHPLNMVSGHFQGLLQNPKIQLLNLRTFKNCRRHREPWTTMHHTRPFRSFFMSRTSGAVGPELSLPRPSPSFHPIFWSISLPRWTADWVVWHSVTDDAEVVVVTDEVATDDAAAEDSSGAVGTLGSVCAVVGSTVCSRQRCDHISKEKRKIKPKT